jgi:hypothetical protein
MKQQIIVDICPNTGMPTVKSEGFVGRTCLEATKPIRDALGTTDSSEPTAEMARSKPQKMQVKQ